MELIEVEITGQAITSRYGTLNTGDILRTDAAFARHLVEDCIAAKYTSRPVVATDPEKTITRKKRDKPAPQETAPSTPSLDFDAEQ